MKLCHAVLVLALAAPSALEAQRIVSQPQQIISVSKGASALLVNPVAIVRVTLGDPAIANASVVSPTEVLINGATLGSTTLLVWDNAGTPRVYSVEVTADAPALQRYIKALLPDEEILVTSSGNTVTLSGTVKSQISAFRAVQLANTTGATVIDNLFTPPAQQVLLQVRFAEVSKSFTRDFAAQLRAVNPHELSDNGDYIGETQSSGSIDNISFFMGTAASNIQALLTAAATKGDFRSLAEPNLLTLPDREASFLAGGEFPFPTLQAANNNNAVTIVFREFGIKLSFTPTIMKNGAIRLKLAPEVSSLDFANALVVQGFEIPTILSRKAETEVELREGQWLAIAGLMDNNMINNVTKIPLLGDLPIIGELFKSRGVRQRRTELLVLVSPRLVTASDVAQPLPTGEPANWGMHGDVTRPVVPRPTPPASQVPPQQ